jgi:lipopolysaccharide export system protein LptA
VRITRGQNQLNGTRAEVNLKTGISRLLPGRSGQVHGLIVPEQSSSAGQKPAQHQGRGATRVPGKASR